MHLPTTTPGTLVALLIILSGCLVLPLAAIAGERYSVQPRDYHNDRHYNRDDRHSSQDQPRRDQRAGFRDPRAAGNYPNSTHRIPDRDRYDSGHKGYDRDQGNYDRQRHDATRYPSSRFGINSGLRQRPGQNWGSGNSGYHDNRSGYRGHDSSQSRYDYPASRRAPSLPEPIKRYPGKRH